MAIEEMLTQLIDQVGDVRECLGAVAAEVRNVKDQTEKIEQHMGAHNGRLDELARKVSTLEGAAGAERASGRRDWRHLLTQLVLMILTALLSGAIGGAAALRGMP